MAEARAITADPAPPDPLGPLPDVLPSVEVRARLPRGFRVGAATAGIKASGRPDLAIVVVERGPGSVAATFTTNQVPAAPVLLSRRHLAATSPDGSGGYGRVDAIISTSGSANAATGPAGLSDQRRLAEALATACSTIPERTLAVSTGMIGTRLPVDRILPEVARLVMSGLSSDDAALADVAEAMRTTDSRSKAATVSVDLPGRDGSPVPVTVSGVAKGVGMIHPRMATMLALVLTDAAADPAVLSSMLRPAVARTWNQLSVDGDTSTNDTVLLVASGASGALPVVTGSEEAALLGAAVEAVARSLARQQAADGEGRHDADHLPGLGRPRRRRCTRRGTGRGRQQPAEGRGPRPRPELGPRGRRGRQRPPGGRGCARSGRRANRRGRQDAAEASWYWIRLCCASGSAARTCSPACRSTSIRPRSARRCGRPRCSSGSTSAWAVARGEAFGCDLTEAYVIENSEYST